MRKAIAFSAASLGIFGALFTYPAASAATSGAQLSSSCDQVMYQSNQWGWANGRYCDGNTRIVGTVKDTAADGRCPYLSADLSNGNRVDSDWAGPAGDTSPIDIWAPPGTTFVHVQIRAIYC
ncbi:hypothetical protein ABZ605_27745 [Streptomyces sp. NPDC012765]|uniref:hypothetical protein n=1 Tax=Streptomyces sp. NPDC012765 TaxID=3155249 RepID=UPI0033E03916